MRTVLTSQRLTFVAPELRHGPAFARQLGDYDVAKMTGSIPHPYLPPAADFWIMQTRAKMRRGLCHSWMIETRSGACIGNISLFRRTRQSDFEIGYHIGREHWGHSYATESARTVIEEARRTGQARLTAGVYDDNLASQHVLAKLGFVATGRDNIWCMARSERVAGNRYALDLTADAVDSMAMMAATP